MPYIVCVYICIYAFYIYKLSLNNLYFPYLCTVKIYINLVKKRVNIRISICQAVFNAKFKMHVLTLKKINILMKKLIYYLTKYNFFLFDFM